MSCRWHLRWIVVTVFAAASAGCLVLPYGFPTIDRIAAVPIPSPGDDVHVFRVDSKATRTEQAGPCFGIYHNVEEVRRLERIDRDVAALIDAQWKVDFEHGRVRVGLLGGVPTRHYHTMALCLYRSGYAMIRVREDGAPRKLEWRPILDDTQRECTVDELLGPLERAPIPVMLLSGGPPVTAAELIRGLLPGSASPAHREALLFCAAEYDRIARIVADDQPEADATRGRLREKANRLRELADRD